MLHTSLMTRSLIEGVLDLLNRLPSKYGVSDTLNPSIILEGRPKVDMRQKNIAFGSYMMNKKQMCPRYCIKSVKLFWWVLFYACIHQETNA